MLPVEWLIATNGMTEVRMNELFIVLRFVIYSTQSFLPLLEARA
jgi:hypothetical protein